MPRAASASFSSSTDSLASATALPTARSTAISCSISPSFPGLAFLPPGPGLPFVGGFSFGDHIASGRVFANRVRYRLGDALARHVDDGGLVIGICNGFQTIVKLGLLPALDRAPGQPLAAQSASLVHNDRRGYRDAWVRLVPDLDSPCVFTRGMTGATLEVPARHGEDVPMGRPAQPEEIAPAFVFFASNPDSSYITGEVLTLLGGETVGA